MAQKNYSIFTPTGIRIWGPFSMEETVGTAWMAGNIAANYWGKPDRWISYDSKELNGIDMSKCDNQRITKKNGVPCIEYHFPADYVVKIT